MLFQINWNNSVTGLRQSLGSSREYSLSWGKALVWTVESGSSLRLNIALKVNPTSLLGRNDRLSYQDPLTYSCPALLAETLQHIQVPASLAMRTHIRVSVLPLGLLIGGFSISSFLDKFGYKASFDDAGVEATYGTLDLYAERTPVNLLRELRVLLAALDPRSGVLLTSEGRTNLGQDLAGIRSRYVPVIELRLAQTLPSHRPVTDYDASPWIIYLPPSGLASVQSASEELENPEAALAYYRAQGFKKAIAQFKHMGSRAVAVVCKDSSAAEKRFGTVGTGYIYTKNAKRFFHRQAVADDFLNRMVSALNAQEFWARFQTDWVCLDGEITPWSLKGEKFHEASLQNLHSGALRSANDVLNALPAAHPWKKWASWRVEVIQRAIRLHSRFSDPETDTICFAPFHLLATEGKIWSDKDHLWHMNELQNLAAPFLKTPFRKVELDCEKSCKAVIRWWEELGRQGHEGIVLKPLPFVPQGARGLAQPALKCRTPEYLRLVYGPEYDDLENLAALRASPATQRRRNKHRRITRQYLLGLQALRHFVEREPFELVRECLTASLSFDNRRDTQRLKEALKVLSKYA